MVGTLQNSRRSAARYPVGTLLVALCAAYLAWFYLLPSRLDASKVGLGPPSLEMNGPGLLDATNKVVITARIQGFIRTLTVDRNDSVWKGQVLATLESVDLANQLAAAQAEANAAGRGIAEAESAREGTKAAAEKARSDFERRGKLVGTGSVSQAEYTNAESAFRQAEAQHARAGAAVERAKAQLAAALANVKVLEQRLQEATIASPIDAVVVNRERSVGDLLSPGAALMHLVDPASIIIAARFDESAMGAIKPSQTAKVRFASNPGRVFDGRVLRLSRQVDQETREFTVDILLEQLPDNWALGQRANVTIHIESLPSLVISQAHIARRDGKPGVWTVRDGRAQWVPVVLGTPLGTAVEVRAGLSINDAVLSPEGRYWMEPVEVSR
jgi:HlyD family secretion protein